MNKTKKLAIIIAVVACLAVTCTAVYATFYITSSPTAPVTVNYSISLTETRGFNPSFTLTATVTDSSSDGGSCITDVPVTFYVNANGAGWTSIGTSHTNAEGIATGSYSIQSNGETDQFQAAIGMP